MNPMNVPPGGRVTLAPGVAGGGPVVVGNRMGTSMALRSAPPAGQPTTGPIMIGGGGVGGAAGGPVAAGGTSIAAAGQQRTDTETLQMQLKKLKTSCLSVFEAASMVMNPGIVTQSQFASEFGMRMEELHSQCDTIHDDITYMRDWYQNRQMQDREIESWIKTLGALEQIQDLHDPFVKALEVSILNPLSASSSSFSATTPIFSTATFTSSTIVAGTSRLKGKPQAHTAEAAEGISPGKLPSPSPSPSVSTLNSTSNSPSVNLGEDKEDEMTDAAVDDHMEGAGGEEGGELEGEMIEGDGEEENKGAEGEGEGGEGGEDIEMALVSAGGGEGNTETEIREAVAGEEAGVDW